MAIWSRVTELHSIMDSLRVTSQPVRLIFRTGRRQGRHRRKKRKIGSTREVAEQAASLSPHTAGEVGIGRQLFEECARLNQGALPFSGCTHRLSLTFELL